MVKVLIKKLSPEVQLPSYKTSGASGMDLMAFIKSIPDAPDVLYDGN
jgi:dUTP pyrophosphatase